MIDEALIRKNRSIEILKSENVPIIEHLPLLEGEIDIIRRTSDKVAIRAMALCFVAAKGEGLEQEILIKMIKEYNLVSEFTPKEKEFIDNLNTSVHDRTQFVWRYECYWVLLWSLGFIDKLERPDKVCDVQLAAMLLRDNGREGFLKKANLRPQNELLDETDLIFRYHWAVVDARLNNRESPAKLEGSVVMERHYALNWLIGYQDQEWDDISTDT